MHLFDLLHTVNTHRRWVRHYCWKLGLVRQGLTHDLSKYSPTEFLVGCKYYQGNRSPNNAEREETGVSKAWLHHKGRNRHHYEYWIDNSVEKDGNPMTGMPMPTPPSAVSAANTSVSAKAAAFAHIFPNQLFTCCPPFYSPYPRPP